jgi:hypothetical protein
LREVKSQIEKSRGSLIPVTAAARRTRVPGLVLGAGILLGVLPGPAAAQELICCNHLVSFGGDWFGALRQCGQKLETATPKQRQVVCQQVRGNFCEDVAPYCQPCKGDEAKKGNPGGTSLGPGDPIFDGMVDGARAAGITGFGPEHFGIQRVPGVDAILRWQIRVDADGCPLPNGDCILWAGKNGYLPEGKQVGAKQLVLGAIQFAGNTLRVNGRYVNVETGVIEGAANSAIVTGTDREAIARAMADMLRKLGLRCQQARGLTY